MPNEAIKLKGTVKWQHHDKDGNLIAEGQDNNLTLTDGFEIICDLLAGLGAQTKLQCIAIGTSDTTPAVGQTDLQGSELARGTTTNERPSSNVARFYFLFGAGVGTGTIKETVVADTNAASGSRKCAARSLIGPIVKAAADSVTIIWEFTFTQA